MPPVTSAAGSPTADRRGGERLVSVIRRQSPGQLASGCAARHAHRHRRAGRPMPSASGGPGFAVACSRCSAWHWKQPAWWRCSGWRSSPLGVARRRRQGSGGPSQLPAAARGWGCRRPICMSSCWCTRADRAGAAHRRGDHRSLLRSCVMASGGSWASATADVLVVGAQLAVRSRLLS